MFEYRPPNQNILALLAFLSLFLLAVQQADQPTALLLTSTYTTTQPRATYHYYQLTFNTSGHLLLITLDSNTSASDNLYISVRYPDSNQTYFTHPNDVNYTHECYQSSLDTCIVRFDPSPHPI